MDEQVIDRQPAAVDQYGDVYDEVEHAFGRDGVEQGDEWDDEHEVVGEETEQLPAGIAPDGTVQAVQEVKGVAKEDTAKNDGGIGVQVPWEDGQTQDQRSACQKERGDEDPE